MASLIQKLDKLIDILESKVTFASELNEPKILVCIYDSYEYPNAMNQDKLGYWESYGNQAYIKRYKVKGDLIKVRILYFYDIRSREQLEEYKSREKGATKFMVIAEEQFNDWTQKFRGAPEVKSSPWSM